jgi:hypothetical protein
VSCSSCSHKFYFFFKQFFLQLCFSAFISGLVFFSFSAFIPGLVFFKQFFLQLCFSALIPGLVFFFLCFFFFLCSCVFFLCFFFLSCFVNIKQSGGVDFSFLFLCFPA